MNRMIAAVSLPIVVLLAWTVLLSVRVSTGSEAKLKVIGFDPRDLLSGHYIQYQIDYELDDICRDRVDIETCVCLGFSPSDGRFIGHWSGSCLERPADTCQTYFLRGVCQAGRFATGIERFYIPEALAPALLTVPEDSSIIVALDGRGGAQVKDFLVEDKPYTEYAERRLAEMAGTTPP